jgi:divalent metal cation (Fe/Co/Zn/Cd) transporter
VLLDTSPEPEIQERIIEGLKSHPNVREVNKLRARFVGDGEIFADANIYVDPQLTIEEGDIIAAEAEKRVKEKLPVKYLIIHVEPFKGKEEKVTGEVIDE